MLDVSRNVGRECEMAIYFKNGSAELVAPGNGLVLF